MFGNNGPNDAPPSTERRWQMERRLSTWRLALGHPVTKQPSPAQRRHSANTSNVLLGSANALGIRMHGNPFEFASKTVSGFSGVSGTAASLATTVKSGRTAPCTVEITPPCTGVLRLSLRRAKTSSCEGTRLVAVFGIVVDTGLINPVFTAPNSCAWRAATVVACAGSPAKLSYSRRSPLSASPLSPRWSYNSRATTYLSR
jgi:hypothetical protein